MTRRSDRMTCAARWLYAAMLTLLLNACGYGAPSIFTPGPTPTNPSTGTTAAPAPGRTLDPYTSFQQSLKAAVENNDEAALRALIGVPWYAGRYKADVTEYLTLADAAAGFRAIRTRMALSVDLNAAGTQPVGTQKLGERIIVAQVQMGNGSEEPAFLYASQIGGAWRWVAFMSGMPAEQVSALPTPRSTATAQAANAIPTPTASGAPTATPSPLPSMSMGNGTLVFTRNGSMLARDLGSGQDAPLGDAAQPSSWAWSRDGQHAIFLKGGPLLFQFWRVERDGSGLKMLAGSGRYSNPQWSPDGSLILYGYRAAEGRDELWLMNPDGSSRHKLSEGFDGAWDPTGQRIAFASNPSGTVGPAGHTQPARNGIHIVNVLGKNEWVPLSTATNSSKFTALEWQMSLARLVNSPQWSPDGSEITLRVEAGHGAYVTTNPATGGFGRFIAVYFDGSARGFSYSPNGKYISVGAGGQSGISTIAIYRRSDIGTDGISGSPLQTLGSVPRRVGDPAQSAGAFAWSPDSSRIAYASDKGGIWVTALADGTSVQVNSAGSGPLFWLP